MILYQKKANPFSVRLLGALFNPIILIFFVIPIVVLVYFALHGDISTSPVKGMWFGACFLLFLSTVAYYNIVKSVRTQLTHAELSSEGLKIQRVNYDEIIETFIPIKEIQLDLKKHQNKNATRSGEWHTYSLQFFDGKSIEPVLVLREKLEKLQEILTKIEQENLIPLQAAEKDFLLLARRPEKFSFLKTYRKASLIGGLIFFLFAIYKVAPIVRTLSFVEESSLAGSWKVIIPLESAGMLITINGDSTASESVFNTPIKWKYKEGDGISNQPAVLTFSTENPGGWGGYDYSIINKTDSVIELKRSFDDRLFRLVKSNEVKVDISDFKKLIGVCDRSYLMPVTETNENDLLNKYLLDWTPDQRPGKTLLQGERQVFLLDGYSGSYIAVFNIGNEVLLSHKNFEGVQGECSHSFSTVTQNGVELILDEYQCIEGDPTLTYYRVADNGTLVANNEPANQWALLDSFRDFPGKWFPLFEGANGLERQQLCGSEGFIEIIELEEKNSFTWREQGYQDAWEAVIQNFEVAGIEVFVYQFFLKSGGDAITEMNVVHDEDHEGVMLFNGRRFTKKPELFPVNNNANDCP